MALHGYAQVSATDQDLAIQEAALRAAGCQVVRAEERSGGRRDGRGEPQVPPLVVTRVDRLARSIADLRDVVRLLNARSAKLKATEQPFDTGDIYGELTLNLLDVFADFETKLRRERQMEGIAAAKARGVYKGRKARIDPTEVRRLRDVEKLGPAAIARSLGIGRASVCRALGAVGGTSA